jgi:hypothetical protein
MKKITAKKEKFEEDCPDLEEISGRLDKIGRGELIDMLNWESFKYKPEARFNIAYSDREVFLKFYIREEFVKAEKTESNQMVCEDSCVEFFVSPSDDGIYYNFEFNPIGTCLMGTGTSREDIIRAPVSLIDTIRRKGSSGINPFKERQGKTTWTITIAIPYEAFFRHNVTELKGKSIRANFYKCGDKLTHPHYLTWNPVGTPRPDYHQPEFFGMVKFV